MLKRILITGASGFVGGHVLRAFCASFANAEILGVGRRASINVPTGAVYQPLDLVDREAVANRVRVFRPTEILHLAGESSVVRAARSKFDAWRTNFGALYNLIDSVERAGEACTFAFISTGEVYGRGFLNQCPVTEQTAPQPMNAYARSKWIGEQFFVESTKGTCIRPIVIRPFNHIGPGQDLAFSVASFAHQIALIEAGRRPSFVEVGNLSAQRDFLDVSDVVAAYIRIFECAEDLKGLHTFNICSGQPCSIENMLLALRELSRVPFEIRPDPARMRPSEVPLAVGDAGRLKQATGWAPRLDKMTSLARILDDARSRVATE